MIISFFGAFVGGVVSFLAPCILPIIPGFLAYLAGSSDVGGGADANTDVGRVRRRQIFINSIFFVLGFSVVFAVLGILLNTVLAFAAYSVKIWLGRIGGVLIIFFGLYLVRLIHIPFLERDYKPTVSPELSKKINSLYVVSFLFGLAFAVGWTPCVGPALGVILGLAASQPGSAFFLLLTYALGLGLPFLIVGFFTAQATAFIARHAKLLNILNIIFGVLLLAIGVLVFTQSLTIIANFSFLNNLILK